MCSLDGGHFNPHDIIGISNGWLITTNIKLNAKNEKKIESNEINVNSNVVMLTLMLQLLLRRRKEGVEMIVD